MKKLYIILIALLMASGVMAQTCLPEGITFSSQSEIDNFQTNYPNCIQIEGDVTISGSDIANLNGLNGLTSIGGDFYISPDNALTNLSGLEGLSSIMGSLLIRGYISSHGVFFNSLTNLEGLGNIASIGGSLIINGTDALTSLTGLEGLSSIGGSLNIGVCIGMPSTLGENLALTHLAGLVNLTTIGENLTIESNESLSDISGLEHVISIGGELQINCNNTLKNLTGLDNIDAGSINGLYISSNPFLTTCAIQSICDYLASPNGTIEIHDNATGCNSPEEVDSACVYLTIGGVNFQSTYTIYPNPASTTITISTPTTPNKNTFMTLIDITGKQIITRQITEQQTVVNVAGLSQGVYFVRVNNDRTVQVGKFVKN